MNDESGKYSDSGDALGAYSDKVFCHCPKCDKKAIVTAEVKYTVGLFFNQAQIQCLNCVYQEKWSPNKLHASVIGVARQPCPHCGHQWLTAEIKATASSKLRKTVSVDCPVCMQRVALAIRWQNDWYSNKPVDPYFGYPLWLQTECCGNALWVYNEKHLLALKSYLEAKRRDGRNRGKWSMISRLPQWMTSAKNREAVLKGVSKLEKLLVDG